MEIKKSETISNSSLGYVKQLRTIMKKEKFMLCYRGSFSEGLTQAILVATERKLDIDGAERGIKKKVFNVMVECLQNICKHNTLTENNKPSLFIIGRSGDEYVTLSGNLISNNKIEELRSKLLRVNNLSDDEIKELYKNIIYHGEFSEVGGAGVGLIDIARKSGNPLDFDFKKLDEEKSLFALKTQISKKGKS